jgi:ubiquinone/menaquinone biosynthesis C-methylase UbiE
VGADNPVDYDRLAGAYHRRYALSPQPAIADRLRALAEEAQARRILEVGCGTAYWLSGLAAALPVQVAGLDLSAGMLAQARRLAGPLPLLRGTAARLPFAGAALDLVYCVNALHHFPDPRSFIGEARRVLRPGGLLAVFGMTPHHGHSSWYVYDYFDGTYATDAARFPTWGTVLDWMLAVGLEHARWQVVDRIVDDKVGRAVLDDPFLKKESTSQLVLLTDEAYATGLRRIEADLAAAEARAEELVFRVRIEHALLVARVP